MDDIMKCPVYFVFSTNDPQLHSSESNFLIFFFFSDCTMLSFKQPESKDVSKFENSSADVYTLSW